MRAFVRIRFDQSPLAQIDFLFLSQKFFGTRLSFFFCERRARRGFSKRVADAMQRPVRLEDDCVLFWLAIAEVTYAPESAWHLLCVDIVQPGNSNPLPQKLIRHRIGRVYEHRNTVERLWIEAPLAKDFIGASLPCLCIHGES